MTSASQLRLTKSNLTSGVHWSVTQCCLGHRQVGSTCRDLLLPAAGVRLQHSSPATPCPGGTPLSAPRASRPPPPIYTAARAPFLLLCRKLQPPPLSPEFPPPTRSAAAAAPRSVTLDFPSLRRFSQTPRPRRRTAGAATPPPLPPTTPATSPPVIPSLSLSFSPASSSEAR